MLVKISFLLSPPPSSKANVIYGRNIWGIPENYSLLSYSPKKSGCTITTIFILKLKIEEPKNPVMNNFSNILGKLVDI